MERYLVVIERTDSGYSAYSPDVPGCITVGETIEETVANMHSAIELHLEMMLSDGDAIPRPRGIKGIEEAEELSEGEEYFRTYVTSSIPVIA